VAHPRPRADEEVAALDVGLPGGKECDRGRVAPERLVIGHARHRGQYEESSGGQLPSPGEVDAGEGVDRVAELVSRHEPARAEVDGTTPDPQLELVAIFNDVAHSEPDRGLEQIEGIDVGGGRWPPDEQGAGVDELDGTDERTGLDVDGAERTEEQASGIAGITSDDAGVVAESLGAEPVLEGESRGDRRRCVGAGL